MREIQELQKLMLELLELPFNYEDGMIGDFCERAIEIIDEVADYAEGTEIYESQKDKSAALDDLDARHTYGYMLDRIGNAPNRLYRDASCILLMPILRQKIKEERMRK